MGTRLRSSFGNELLWRPNALGGFRTYVPQNYARPLFDDVELFKANGLVGTDFDCNDGCFATKGLVYYMLARALLNPDHLDYETIYADYLRAGFGPAADAMRTWFDSLEADFDKAAGLDVSAIPMRLWASRRPVSGSTIRSSVPICSNWRRTANPLR